MRPHKKWLLAFGVWTILGLLSASQHLAWLTYADRPFSAWKVLGRTLLDWYTCGVFTPAIFFVARRFRLDARGWALMLPVHLLACALFIVAKLALFLPIAHALDWLGEPINFTQSLYNDAFPLTLTYAAVAGAWYAIDYYERYRLLARVQLDALRAQLHPHFLFNALNALSTLVHRDPHAADRMIVELGDLLRQTLSEDRAPEVTLQEELRLIERYVGIMQIRYGDRLTVHYDVDSAVLAAYVPHMVLQPLVENALVHGIGRAAGAGNVVIRARRQGEQLGLEVEDDGAGLDVNPVERIGLRNTRALLERLYGKDHALAVRARNGRGVLVTVMLPFHLEPVLS
ncbi:MAG TPA: histidine kinase [Longimicrobiales bacterium]